jgi:hypothetical protein
VPRFPPHIVQETGLGSKPGLRGDSPATNRLRQGTALKYYTTGNARINVTLRCVRATVVAVGKSMSITYFECVFLALGIGHAMLLLFSRLYNVSTSSCAHLTIIISSSSSCLCHSSLLPSILFLPSFL